MWWLILALLITGRYFKGSIPFNLGWWGFTFPLGVKTVRTGLTGREASSPSQARGAPRATTMANNAGGGLMLPGTAAYRPTLYISTCVPNSMTRLSGSLKYLRLLFAFFSMKANRLSRQRAMPIRLVGTTVSRLRK